MMYTLQNRKMPSLRTVRLYLFTSLALALISGLLPGALAFSMLAVCFSSVALLSVPRITYTKILILLTAEALVAAGTTLLLTRNAAACFAAAAFAPASALLVLTIRRRYSRTCGIILASIGMGLFYLACYLLAIYLTYNRFSLDLFRELYVSLEENFIATMHEYFDSTAVQLSSVTIDDETLAQMLKMVMTLLPAILINMILVTVWFSTVFLRFIFKNYIYGQQRFADWKVTMNRPSAWVFFICILLLFIPLPESISLLTALPMNILLILTPGFFCVGCSVWKARLFLPGRRPPFLMILLLVLIGLFSPIFLIPFVAFAGVTHLIFQKKKQSEPDNNI